MPFSFRTSAPTVAQLNAAVELQLVRLRDQAPAHQKGFDQAYVAAKVFIDLLEDDPPRAAVPAVLETEDAPGIPAIPAYPGRAVHASVHCSMSSVDGQTVQAATVSVQIGYESIA